MIIKTNKITFEEYQKLAQRTASTTTARDKLINGALGLCGEITEYSMERLYIDRRVDEAGDIMWYIAEISAGLGVTIADVAAIDGNTSYRGMHDEAGLIADAVKKCAFQGHSADDNKTSIIYGMNRIMGIIARYVVDFGFTMDDVLSGNVEKLLRRYPDGFDAKRSVHR